MIDLKAWHDIARHDDVFDRMVPSDLREILGEVERLRAVLDRCNTVLANMALENVGAPSVVQRWPISHEPLRADAKGLLPVIAAVLDERKHDH